MKKILFVFLLIISSLVSKNTFASHAAGGELTYEFVSGSTYRFTLKFYRDCTGGPSANDSAGMCYYNSCNNTYYKKFLTKVPILPGGAVNGSPVPTGCPNPTQCTSPTSSIPGFEEWWYQGEVTLNAQCTEWVFWFNEVARNPQYNTTNGNLHIQATLNNLAAQGNSSPDFTFKPVPYICLNQLWVYNNGAVDPDGDSLSYASITPYTSGSQTSTTGQNCTGNVPAGTVGAGFSFPLYNPASNAIPSTGYGINPQTGIISCTPTIVSTNVITIQVTEWRNGIPIGRVLRDIQVAIVNCAVPIPSASLPTSSLNGVTFNPNTTYYDACIGDTISFCVVVGGPDDTAQILSLNNIPLILPGSVVTTTGIGTDTVTICVTWVSTALDTGLSVMTIQFQDTNCLYNPIAVISSFSIPIYIYPSTDGYGDTTICIGASAQLSAVGGSSFTWSVLPGGSPIGSLSCTNCSNPIATPTTTTYYVVTSNLTTICSDNVDTIEVIVPPSATVNAGPDNIMCVNGTYQMQASVTPAIGSYTYVWSPATSLSATNVLNPLIINPNTSITYTLTVIPNGVSVCAISDAMTNNVLTGFNILNNDTTICENGTVFIATTGSNSYNYSWTPTLNVSNPAIKNPIISPDSTTTYVLTASYPGCPDSVQSITIGVEYLPIVKAGTDRIICEGDTARLSASVTPLMADPFYTYLWSPAANLNNVAILDPTFNGTTNSNLTITVNTPKGCIGTDNIAIQVVPKDFLSPISDKEYCPGGSVNLTTNGAVTYFWQPGMWVSDSLANSVTAFPIATTVFTIYGTDVFGCADTITMQVFVAPNAQMYLGPDATIFPGQSYQINSTGNCSNYNWSPATGLNATNVSNPIAQPSTTTQYVINATTEYNCPYTDTIIVNVLGNSLISLPNAFSPGNGSTVNDEFKIITAGTATLNYFRVFNRWGELVFETTDINKGWNGKVKDQPQPIGTYIYQIDVKDAQGKSFAKTGSVALIR